jgi:hypothetical protein
LYVLYVHTIHTYSTYRLDHRGSKEISESWSRRILEFPGSPD